MKIAIIGGGNGGYAAAADLTNNGHEIYFWQRSKDSSKALIKNTSMDAKEIAVESLNIAADICIYTNHNIISEIIEF